METALELSLHLHDGRIVHYRQDNEEQAKATIGRIFAPKAFAQKAIILWSSEETSVYPSDRISRVSVDGRFVPSPNLASGVLDARSLDRTEFFELAASTADNTVIGQSRVVVLFAEIEMVNLEKVFVRIISEADERPAIDIGMFLQQRLFTGAIHLKDGHGVTILNADHIVRIKLHPSTAIQPAGAWSAKEATASLVGVF